jgi:hypothetical protein
MDRYIGTVGGYVHKTRADAAKACEKMGMRLCSRSSVVAAAKRAPADSRLANVCTSGWTADEGIGWYSQYAKPGCGAKQYWNTWNPIKHGGDGASAHCCKFELTKLPLDKKVTWEQANEMALDAGGRLPTQTELRQARVSARGDVWHPVEGDDWVQVAAGPRQYFSHNEKFGPAAWSGSTTGEYRVGSSRYKNLHIFK